MTEYDRKPMIGLTWKQCEIMASYYRFPTYVFLLTEKNMKSRLKGTRKDALLAKISKVIDLCSHDYCPTRKEVLEILE